MVGGMKFLAAAIASTVLLFGGTVSATDTNQPEYWESQTAHKSWCYKHEANQSGDSAHGHGKSRDNRVKLNVFDQDWNGDHWELLVVKAGNGYLTYDHPASDVWYDSPEGKTVSHWIVCKGETPPSTTTTTTTTTSTTTTTVPETTTTTEATTSTSTSTTPDTTSSTSTLPVQSTTTTSGPSTTLPAPTTTVIESTTTSSPETTSPTSSPPSSSTQPPTTSTPSPTTATPTTSVELTTPPVPTRSLPETGPGDGWMKVGYLALLLVAIGAILKLSQPPRSWGRNWND